MIANLLSSLMFFATRTSTHGGMDVERTGVGDGIFDFSVGFLSSISPAKSRYLEVDKTMSPYLYVLYIQ